MKNFGVTAPVSFDYQILHCLCNCCYIYLKKIFQYMVHGPKKNSSYFYCSAVFTGQQVAGMQIPGSCCTVIYKVTI